MDESTKSVELLIVDDEEEFLESSARALSRRGFKVRTALDGTRALELIGALGNILSYLRIAAVGLASAYLAIVANEFAAVGPLWLGIIIAAFFHALNLALAGFSPMIQAMRLHYVEFFSKFYAGGGRMFRPFGARVTASPTVEKPLDYDTIAP